MTLRQTVLLVALLNLAYFGVEFAVALAIGSVSLFADSVDFLEDASLNLLIVMALGWSPLNRARVGMALAAILLVPVLATLWTAWQKFLSPMPPAPVPAFAHRRRSARRQPCLRLPARQVPPS
jgi:Co/Zn/Cd efflux system component